MLSLESSVARQTVSTTGLQIMTNSPSWYLVRLFTETQRNSLVSVLYLISTGTMYILEVPYL